jgi:nucleolar MIF4G domain-containing protein 1
VDGENQSPRKINFSAASALCTTMSRRPQQRNGLKLPRQLQQELGLNPNGPNGPKARHGKGGVGARRDGRNAERAELKVGRFTGHPRRLSQPQKTIAADYGGFGEEAESESAQEQRVVPQLHSRKDTAIARPQRCEVQERKPKSILKKRAAIKDSDSSSEGPDQGRSPSPGLVLDKSSKSFLDRAAQDDAEVAALEKKLGVRSKKLPKSFNEDGLADLLEGIYSEEEGGKRKREGQDWLDRKRRRVEADDSEEESDESGQNNGSGSEGDDLLGESSEPFDSEEEHFDGFDSEDADAEKEPTTRKRENPYVAPRSYSAKPMTKYLPPSLRKQTEPDTEALQRLRRQMQGQLNKLSEANLVSILAEVEKSYQTNARQDVTSTLVGLLLSLFGDPSVLQNTFVILHASFVSSIYKVIGTDFGAEFVSQLVHRFEGFHKPAQVAGGKQSVNLISLLCHLFTFHVIGSNLVFDHIRLLLETLSEMNAELLLRIVRDAGPQLRHDDPSSLKDIVLIMQSAAARAQADDVAISVRTKFMIETITDLKNNKLKAEVASAGVASEHITRMRKVLGSLNSRNIRASEPLRIGLSDLKNADKRGKWWLIGASWKENEKKLDSGFPNAGEHSDGIADVLDGEEADLVALARQHRMNTAVRRAIFIVIMSANDYQDAHLRLLKLRLKRSQEQEIPRVLLHCAGAEEKYNPYYVLIAKTLCADKRLKMAFQFSLWDFFKRMGEKGDDMDSDDEDDLQEVQLNEIVNIARMYGTLVADGTMSLGILKTLDLALLKEQARMFAEVFLVVVISKSQEGVKGSFEEDRLAKIFARCKDAPQMIRGLRHFLKQVVRHTDLASSKAEARQVKLGCGVAIDTLKMVSSGHGGQM